MNEQILIPQAVAEGGTVYLQEHGYRIKMGTGWDEASLIHDVKGCSAILLRTAIITRRVIEAEPKLKIVARHGVGFDNVDLAAADENGVYVTNCPFSNSNSVAECTIGLLLAISKKLMELSDSLRNGNFFYKNNHKGVDLEGKTLGIIGYGKIGKIVAKKAALGFGMKILAYDPFVKPEDMPDYVIPADRDTVFQTADFVTLHLPLSNKTQKSVGSPEFKMMKKDAYLINCARGKIINEEELVTALEEREIAGAALDVFDPEPPEMDNPIFKLDNAVLTPHIASNTVECMERMARHAAMEIHKVLSGEDPSWPVNHPVKK
ncbi:MAG: hydroxyacid dehydrogenase [Oscillospiraceae bacterium]